MTTAEEHRHIAEEFFRMAREAKTEEERKRFFDMALSWSEAAARATSSICPARTISSTRRPSIPSGLPVSPSILLTSSSLTFPPGTYEPRLSHRSRASSV